ncbi:ParB/RepB/Spo0J family partition protein [Salipiger mucosus]|uniref:Plasmid replication protein RepB n=1 Tax=Salipiger mucosus DSM 16094 TaxID=1123237 RepID=S9RN66_9RHOB|nr:ParB/RepB/Spo0J family partition protein [Salipiger mucosus]EPX75424.1 Plasmid replication protein RepB [Salipiger mucosus DSM 16094]
MAKRKRLTPAQPGMFGTPSAGLSRAPIAEVAGEAAAASAFDEVAGELARARDEGRLVLRLPLGEIDTGHMTRDRLALEPEAFAELKDSLRARGQQTPVEVLGLGGDEAGARSAKESASPRYGLISGWRRMLALRELHEETGETRFAEVLALLRRPEDTGAAWRAMVEENEIRAALSLYERARVVREALRQGVFDSEKAALHGLFPAVSYSKRSKIKTAMAVAAALDGALRFPDRLSEHAVLALARRLSEDAELGPRLRAALTREAPGTAEAEAALIERLSRPAADPAPAREAAPAPAPKERFDECHRFSPRLRMEIDDAGQRLVISGERVDADLVNELKLWLAARA